MFLTNTQSRFVIVSVELSELATSSVTGLRNKVRVPVPPGREHRGSDGFEAGLKRV